MILFESAGGITNWDQFADLHGNSYSQLPPRNPLIPTPANMPTAQASYWETKPAIHIKFLSANVIRKRSLKYNLLIALWAGTTILTSTKSFENSGPTCVIFRIVYKIYMYIYIRIMTFFIQYYKTRRSHSPKNKCVRTSRNRTPMKGFFKSNLSISILQEKPEKLTISIID